MGPMLRLAIRDRTRWYSPLSAVMVLALLGTAGCFCHRYLTEEEAIIVQAPGWIRSATRGAYGRKSTVRRRQAS